MHFKECFHIRSHKGNDDQQLAAEAHSETYSGKSQSLFLCCVRAQSQGRVNVLKIWGGRKF